MWARVSVYENSAEAASGFEAGLEFFKVKLLPIARLTPGWIATFNLATPERDRSITISLWASREQMLASEQAAPEVSVQAGRGGRGSAVSVDWYEVTLAECRNETARR